MVGRKRQLRTLVQIGAAAGLLAASLALLATASAWSQVEHDASMTPIASPRYEGRDNQGASPLPLPNVYAATNAGTWNALAGCDDCTRVVSPPGFSFPWYGSPRSTFELSSNGFLAFTATGQNGCCSGQPIPTGSQPDDLVAGYWNDLNPGAGGNWGWRVMNPHGNLSREVFVARWDNVPHFGGTCCVSFQIHLFEDTGAVEVHYDGAVADGSFETGGVEAAGGGTGVRYFYGTTGVQRPAVQYRPFGAGPVARPDAYATTFVPNGLFQVDGSTLVGVSDNDLPVGNVPLAIDPTGVGTPTVVGTSTPWGSVAMNANGTFSFQMPTTCPSGMTNLNVTFAYRQHDGWMPSNSANATIAVTGCNTAPVAGDDTLAVLEGPGPSTLPVLQNDVDADPGDRVEIDSVVSFGGPGTLAVAPGRQTLLYAPPFADFNGAIHGGPLHAVYRVRDGRGGTDDAALTIQVAPVNDAPLYAAATDLVSVPEGTLAAVSQPWASGMAAGPATASDEAGQSLSFVVVSNSNPSLFAAGGLPAVDGAGTLTFRLRDGDVNRLAPGEAVLSVVLRDNGPGFAPDVDSSAPRTLRIRVEPVNDAPFFTPGAGVVTVDEGGDPRTVAWATGLSAGGGPDEATQRLAFTVDTDLPGLFAPDGQPTVDAAGNLRFRLLDGDVNRLTHGEAEISVTIFDDGPGTAPDANVGNSATLLLVVEPVNDPPVFAAGPDVQLLEGSSSLARTYAWATGIGPGGGSDEAGQDVAFGATTTTTVPGLFSVAPAVAPDGTLTFTVSGPDAYGDAEVEVRLRDDGLDVAPHEADGAPHVLRIHVVGVNDAPVAEDDALVAPLLPDVPAQPLPDLLANDHDADHANALLRVAALDAAGLPGTLALGADGRSVAFTPAPGFNGTATFRYRATDGLLSSAWADVSFLVEAPTDPLVFVRPTPAQPCLGVPQDLLGVASWRGYTPVRWAWQVDGVPEERATVSAVDLVRRTFTGTGPLGVTLDVTFRRDADGALLPGPTAEPGLSVRGCTLPDVRFQAVLTGLAARFEESSSDPQGVVAWSWTFGDGAASNLREPVHTYAAPGVYAVRLEATDAEGDRATLERTIVVTATASGVFAAGGVGGVGGSGGSGGAGVGDAVAGTAADGSGDAAAPPAAGPAPTSDPSAAAAPVNRPPVARAAGPASAPAGDVVVLDAAGSSDPDGDALHYRWRQVEGPAVVLLNADTARPTLRAPEAAGRLVFEVEVADAFARSTARVATDVAVVVPPEAAFVALPDPADPARVAFADLSRAGPSATYAWDFGDGATSEAREPRHTYAQPGTYAVRLTIREGGAAESVVRTVVVAVPTAAQDPVPAEPQDAAPAPAQPADLGAFGPLALAFAVVVLVLALALVLLIVRRR